MKQKLLLLLVLLTTAATTTWAQRLYLDVNGTSATLKYSATAADYEGKPSYSGGWSSDIGALKTTIQTITTDATSCANFSGTAINSLFSGFTALTSADLRGLNTANVTVMHNLFGNCKALTSVDLSGWNTSKATNMGTLFYYCENLTSVDLSSWDTSSATGMGSMFSGCSALTSVNLSNFNTSNVTTMGSMFNSCSSLTTLDLSSFNTSKVYAMPSMFLDCTNLATIYVGNNWSTAEVTSSDNMFRNCTKLPNYNSSKFDKTNAHTGEGGYLSSKTYKVTLNDTKDAANWTITPAEATTTGVSKGKTVTLTYSGRLKVKNVKATTDAAPPAPKPIADVTTEDVGKLIGLDGLIYVSKSAATAASTTAVAVIAYVGSETDDNDYKHGIAIALADESGTMNWSTAKTTCEGKTAVTNAKWCLPSGKQWRQMCEANGGNNDNCNGLYTTITTHEGTAWQPVKYWTSTEPVSGYKSYFRPTVDGSGGLEIMMDDPNNSYYARACLVF